ncbi:MAG TPA: hypothetical protein VMU07_01840 [Candidatus Paceibacterota bacterium]|nr:hypothetical protein [Candidatus Paceibacterota bacterium]
MPHIIDNKIYHDGREIAWIDGKQIKTDSGNQVLGYIGTEHVYDAKNNRIAYIENDALHFENGEPSVSLEKVNQEIQGTYPLNVKCAVYVLVEY